MLPSLPMEAYWTSNRYQKVAEYSGILQVTNENPAWLDRTRASITQASQDFEIETIYNIRFTPRNPIPQNGWLKIVYPVTISISDKEKFI